MAAIGKKRFPFISLFPLFPLKNSSYGKAERETDCTASKIIISRIAGAAFLPAFFLGVGAGGVGEDGVGVARGQRGGLGKAGAHLIDPSLGAGDPGSLFRFYNSVYHNPLFFQRKEELSQPEIAAKAKTDRQGSVAQSGVFLYPNANPINGRKDDVMKRPLAYVTAPWTEDARENGMPSCKSSTCCNSKPVTIARPFSKPSDGSGRRRA